MKRSEMVEILIEAIEDNIDYAIDTGTTYSGESILDALEKAGMLPPVSVKKTFKKFSTGGYYEYSEVTEWEP